MKFNAGALALSGKRPKVVSYETSHCGQLLQLQFAADASIPYDAASQLASSPTIFEGEI